MTGARHCDVAIVGAGPAGSVAAALLARKGRDVVVLERQAFPRFSIGESLLPQCMAVLEEAGLLDAVEAAGFQTKNGAVFEQGDMQSTFDFADKFTAGWSRTYQVQRARFDHLLADGAGQAGADILFESEITGTRFLEDRVELEYTSSDNTARRLTADYCLDASGFSRHLLQKLSLERANAQPPRQSIFTHVVDNISAGGFDRDKILIVINERQPDIWYWLIPFENGMCSLGVVGPSDALDGGAPEARLLEMVAEAAPLRRLLTEASVARPPQRISNYATNATRTWGPRFALLGNAGGFLDPVFSSGVTIALKSASYGAATADRALSGEAVDWERDFGAPVSRGVETFRAFVDAWYDGALQDIIFAERPDPQIRRMICSVLAGYAWDQDNPYVARSAPRLAALAKICRGL